MNPLSAGFHAHHKDGDHSNNSYENLELLCIPCHYYKTVKQMQSNPLEEHKKLQRVVISGLLKAIEETVNKSIKGTDLERITAAYSKILVESWKEKGLAAEVQYPSGYITFIRNMMEEKLLEKTFYEGFKAGIKAGAEALKDSNILSVEELFSDKEQDED